MVAPFKFNNRKTKTMNNNSTAFDFLRSEVGESAACDILNERIAARMEEEHPDYTDLEPCEKDALWAEYCERYTGAAADELLPEYCTAELPTDIFPEHKALAAELVEKLQNMELPNVKATYEATRDAVNELSFAMYRQYHVDALPAIADLFNELFEATGNVCGSVSAHFFNEETDEDGEVLGDEEVGTWEAATYAMIATREVNWSPAPKCVWAETFAGEVAYSIVRCISCWEYYDSDTDHDSDYQDFTFRK
jgi:hypothetical protein